MATLCQTVAYLIPPYVVQFWEEKVRGERGRGARRRRRRRCWRALLTSVCIFPRRRRRPTLLLLKSNLPPLLTPLSTTRAQPPPKKQAKSYGPILSGALFGAGWWFWVDAVVCNAHKVPFDQYIPGIVATLALIMINCIRREELLAEYDAFDDGGFCRSRFWLFLSYVVSFASVVGAVWVLLQHYALNPEQAGDVWPGVAGVFQVACILGSGLMFFVSRTPSDGGGGGGGGWGNYSGF